MRGWYIVHTLASQEKRAAGVIRKKIEDGTLKDIVFDVQVPVEYIYEMKNGKKIKKERKFFPGYILIDMDLNEQTMRMVRSLPGITTFLGYRPGKLPKPISSKEVEEILARSREIKEEIETTPSRVIFSIDETVKIIDGPFKGFQGVVEEINPEKGRVKVQVEIFGRPTPVDLDFLQIEKIS